MISSYRLALLFFTVLFCAALTARAADYPEPKQGNWVARDFRFHTGEVFPALKLHYRTIGTPAGDDFVPLRRARRLLEQRLVAADGGEAKIQ